MGAIGTSKFSLLLENGAGEREVRVVFEAWVSCNEGK